MVVSGSWRPYMQRLADYLQARKSIEGRQLIVHDIKHMCVRTTMVSTWDLHVGILHVLNTFILRRVVMTTRHSNQRATNNGRH